MEQYLSFNNGKIDRKLEEEDQMKLFRILREKWLEFRHAMYDLHVVLRRVDKLSKQIEMDQVKWDRLKQEEGVTGWK